MSSQFEMERFDLVKTDRVHIPDFKFGDKAQGKLDVWIDSSNKGKRFLRQITFQGRTRRVLTGMYTRECYILREKATKRYYFLDMNDYGTWLFNETFFGAVTFYGDESKKIRNWLVGTPQ